jgi:hypothetical protein
MDLPVKLELEIRTPKEEEIVNNLLKSLRSADTSAPSLSETLGNSATHELLARVKFRKLDASKEARLLIAGKTIATGTIEDMTKRYQTECAMHKSDVTLQQWENGNFKVSRVRRLQRT